MKSLILIIFKKFDYLNFLFTFPTLIYHFPSLNILSKALLFIISSGIKLEAFTSDFNLQIVKKLSTHIDRRKAKENNSYSIKIWFTFQFRTFSPLFVTLVSLFFVIDERFTWTLSIQWLSILMAWRHKESQTHKETNIDVLSLKNLLFH